MDYKEIIEIDVKFEKRCLYCNCKIDNDNVGKYVIHVDAENSCFDESYSVDFCSQEHEDKYIEELNTRFL